MIEVTLTRVYKKEVKIIIDNNLIKEKNDEAIHTFLQEEYEIKNQNELFEKADLKEIPFENLKMKKKKE